MDLEKKNLQDLILKSNELIKELTTALLETKAENEKMVEKVKTFDLLTETTDLFEMAEVSKILAYKNFGRNTIFGILKDEGVLRKNREPYQRYVDGGYFKIIMQYYIDFQGNKKPSPKTMITHKGIDYIRKILEAYNGGNE